MKDDPEKEKEKFRDEVILNYFNRSLYTLQELTRLLKIDFHYERIFKKYETSYTIETVILLMSRARKMYAAITMILKILKLLDKLAQMIRYNGRTKAGLLGENLDPGLELLRMRVEEQD